MIIECIDKETGEVVDFLNAVKSTFYCLLIFHVLCKWDIRIYRKEL